MTNLEIVKRWAEDYNGKSVTKPSSIEDGIEYYLVGHNASHQFSLGVDADGNFWRLSFGEDSWDSETGEITYKKHIRKVGPDISQVGYIGHF